jgi:hypothetical protein
MEKNWSFVCCVIPTGTSCSVQNLFPPPRMRHHLEVIFREVVSHSRRDLCVLAAGIDLLCNTYDIFPSVRVTAVSFLSHPRLILIQ